MDSEANFCSQRSVVETPSCTHFRKPSIAVELETHPLWSAARATRSEKAAPYTDGPSRIFLANDGSKDCLALLLTPSLVAALNQTTHDVHELERKDGALERIESELTDLTSKADKVLATIRNPRRQDRAEEMQLALEILQLKQQEAQERKTQLHLDSAPFETRLKSSRSQSQAIFEEALLEARLLDPPEPVSAPLTSDVHDDVDDDDTLAGYYSDAPSAYEGTEPTPEQHMLREARMDVIENYEVLRTHQARFDDRRADYERKLAEFRQSERKCEGTRTLFDHRHVQHVRELTRDLLAAERGYRTAKAKVKALEVPADGFDADADGGGRRGDDFSIETNVDRERVEAWRRGVVSDYDVEILGNGESVDLDEWNAKPVEIMDSISMVDRDDYVDEINDWKRHCEVLREEASTGEKRWFVDIRVEC